VGSNNSRRRAAASRQRPAATAWGVSPGVTDAAAAASASAALAPRPAATAAPRTDIFSLDALANESSRARFQFEAGGRIWYMRSPEELNWLQHSVAVQFAVMEDLRPFLREVLAEQYEKFVELPIELTKIYALIAEYQKWHGVKIPESLASRRS